MAGQIKAISQLTTRQGYPGGFQDVTRIPFEVWLQELSQWTQRLVLYDLKMKGPRTSRCSQLLDTTTTQKAKEEIFFFSSGPKRR